MNTSCCLNDVVAVAYSLTYFSPSPCYSSSQADPACLVASSRVDMHNIAVEMIGTEVAVASSNRDYELIDFRQLDVAALLGWHLEATAWLHSWNFA